MRLYARRISNGYALESVGIPAGVVITIRALVIADQSAGWVQGSSATFRAWISRISDLLGLSSRRPELELCRAHGIGLQTNVLDHCPPKLGRNQAHRRMVLSSILSMPRSRTFQHKENGSKAASWIHFTSPAVDFR